MKTKPMLMLLLFSFIINTGSSFSISYQNPQISNGHNLDIPPDTTPIELKGMLDYGAGPNDVVATINGDFIQIIFYRNFGNVNIDLYDDLEVLIYNDVINTSVQTMVMIPINSSSSGTYTLVLSNGIGIAEGEFDR